jgi:hypothetical protein
MDTNGFRLCFMICSRVRIRSLYPESRWRTVAAVTVRSRDLPSALLG